MTRHGAKLTYSVCDVNIESRSLCTDGKMVQYGKCNFLIFCLISPLILSYCLQSEARFVDRDTVKDQITTGTPYMGTNPDSTKLNNKDVNDNKKSIGRPSKTEEPNTGVSKIATAVTDEQDLMQKKGDQSPSSSPVTERDNLKSGNRSAFQLSRNTEYNQDGSQEDKSLKQTQETTLTSLQENKVNDVAKLGEPFKKYTTSMPRTDFPSKFK